MRLIDADLLRKNMEFICMGIMAGTDPYDAPLTEIDNAPTVEERPQGEWIPIKTRPLTEEEKEEYPDCSFMYDCKMPEDEQEVLVSTKWGVCTDIYCKDVDGCYFEDHCDEEDVLAWMPFPKPYEED